MSMLEGKVVLLTGAGSGVGRATTIAGAREAACVAVLDLDADGSEETIRLVQSAGGEAVFIQTDVTGSSQMEAAVRKTVETFGRLDCAFNNAGVVIDEPVLLADYAEAAWDKMIAVNLKGVRLGMKHQIPAMLQSGGGAIVNKAAVMEVVAGCCCSYVASKHGVIGLIRTAAICIQGNSHQRRLSRRHWDPDDGFAPLRGARRDYRHASHRTPCSERVNRGGGRLALLRPVVLPVRKHRDGRRRLHDPVIRATLRSSSLN